MEIINNIEEIYNEVLLNSFKCLFCNQIFNKKDINHIKLCIKTKIIFNNQYILSRIKENKLIKKSLIIQ